MLNINPAIAQVPGKAKNKILFPELNSKLINNPKTPYQLEKTLDCVKYEVKQLIRPTFTEMIYKYTPWLIKFKNREYDSEKRLVKLISKNGSYVKYEYDEDNGRRLVQEIKLPSGVIKKYLPHSGKRHETILPDNTVIRTGDFLERVDFSDGRIITYHPWDDSSLFPPNPIRVKEVIFPKTGDEKFNSSVGYYEDGSLAQILYANGSGYAYYRNGREKANVDLNGYGQTYWPNGGVRSDISEEGWKYYTKYGERFF